MGYINLSPLVFESRLTFFWCAQGKASLSEGKAPVKSASASGLKAETKVLQFSGPMLVMLGSQ